MLFFSMHISSTWQAVLIKRYLFIFNKSNKQFFIFFFQFSSLNFGSAQTFASAWKLSDILLNNSLSSAINLKWYAYLKSLSEFVIKILIIIIIIDIIYILLYWPSKF